MKNTTEYLIEYNDLIKNDEILSKRTEYIIIWKMVHFDINIMLGSLITSIGGKQMKKIFTNNIKHMLEDY